MSDEVKNTSAEEKLELIKVAIQVTDGWPDGETFYQSAVEEIRDILKDNYE